MTVLDAGGFDTLFTNVRSTQPPVCRSLSDFVRNEQNCIEMTVLDAGGFDTLLTAFAALSHLRVSSLSNFCVAKRVSKRPC